MRPLLEVISLLRPEVQSSDLPWIILHKPEGVTSSPHIGCMVTSTSQSSAPPDPRHEPCQAGHAVCYLHSLCAGLKQMTLKVSNYRRSEIDKRILTSMFLLCLDRNEKAVHCSWFIHEFLQALMLSASSLPAMMKSSEQVLFETNTVIL